MDVCGRRPMKRNPLLVYGLTLAALILTALLLNKYDRRSSQALSIRDPSDSKPASDEIVCSVIDGETHIAQHGQHASMIAPRADKLISAPEPVMDYVRDDGTLAAGITRDDATHAGLLAGWELLLADNPNERR